MRQTLWTFLLVSACASSLATTKWSKEILDSGPTVTRERRQFHIGDWVPLSQPCISCRTLTDPADIGRRQEDFGLTPPRPPTVSRQIHKTTFFPQDESSILSVPPPPVFNRNQLSSSSLQSPRFTNFVQQFSNPNSLQFETQPVFTQTQFLPQTFLSNPSLLSSNFPQVIPQVVLSDPNHILVEGNLHSNQEIKTSKGTKIPNLQENVLIEQKRQQQHHLKSNQIPAAPVTNLQLPLPHATVNFAPGRQQNIIESNILTPPPAPNNTFPDIVIPGLGKEEIQLLYVPLETLKQRSQQQQQQLQFKQQQQLQLKGQQQQLPLKQQPQQGQLKTQQIQPQQVNLNQQPLQFDQKQISYQQQQRVTSLPQNVKFTTQQQTRSTERPTTQPAGHFITHSATPATLTTGTTFRQVPVTPSTLFFQHLPFEQSQTPVVSSTPSPTHSTFLTPSPLTQKFSPFTSVTPAENLITLPEDIHFTQEFFTTPRPILDQGSFKEPFGKNVFFDQIHDINKIQSVTTPSRVEQQKQVFVEQQRKEEERQKLIRQEHEQKLLLEQERERQQKSQRERQERERQEKIIREQQEREKQQKLIREQQERERQEKLIRQQQERERQEKLIRQQQERERQEKLIREQQERERQQKLIREQQERERQEKIIREQKEREKQQQLFREQQERERQQQILREQKERERQEKIFREQQERERQQKILREQQERERQQQILRQQEMERQQKLIREQQEREIQEQILKEQQERERQNLLRQQQEEERREKLLLEEKLQQELLAKQQRERAQQLALQEQQDGERQYLQQQHFALPQQQVREQLPTQFDLQPHGIPSTTPSFEIQTEEPDNRLVPHQPPLSVFFGSPSGHSRVGEVLRSLKGARSISVLDQYLENIPKVFVGPATLTPPKGYTKFDLPYLSNIDVSRLEKNDRIPFFVAPLNFVPPTGYSKIPFPAPHVGSVVVSSETNLRQPGSSTISPPSVRTTLAPKLRISTTSQNLHPRLKQKENSYSNADSELTNDRKTDGLITTTALPETTTRGRRPFYRVKQRRPTTLLASQTTPKPAPVESQTQKPEPPEKRPGIKYPKRGRPRVKTTTANPEVDALNAANRQFLVETSPSAVPKISDDELQGKDYLQQGIGRTEVQGLFEVENPQGIRGVPPVTEGYGNIDFTHGPTQNSFSSVAGDQDFLAFVTTTQSPTLPTISRFDTTKESSNPANLNHIGKTDYFVTTERTPTSAVVENSGTSGFYHPTSFSPIEIENNGFHNIQSSGGVEISGFYANERNAAKDISSYENRFSETTPQAQSGSENNSESHNEQQQQDVVIVGQKIYHDNLQIPLDLPVSEVLVNEAPDNSQYSKVEQITEFSRETSTIPHESVNENIQKDTEQQYEEIEKQSRPPPQEETTAVTSTTPPRIKSQFRFKSRGQVNFASSQTSTNTPVVRKRIVYKTRKEHSHVNGTEEDVKHVQKFRGHRKGYQTSTDSGPVYEGNRNTVKPRRRFSVSTVLRRRKPVTSIPETTSQNYPQNFEAEFSPSGVSNDVFDDQIRESSLSRNRYSPNVATYYTTSTTTTPAPETTDYRLQTDYTRRHDDFGVVPTTQQNRESETENYTERRFSEGYFTDIWKTSIEARQSTTELPYAVEEDVKKRVEMKKASDSDFGKKNGRRRIRIRVHKRPHEQIEVAESQNLGTVANALIPPTPPKPSAEPDLYRFSKSGFNFDQSEKFTGTKNQAYVRNITSEILENTATFSAPGIETETELTRVTIAGDYSEEESTTAVTTPTTTTTAPPPTTTTTTETIPESTLPHIDSEYVVDDFAEDQSNDKSEGVSYSELDDSPQTKAEHPEDVKSVESGYETSEESTYVKSENSKEEKKTATEAAPLETTTYLKMAEATEEETEAPSTAAPPANNFDIQLSTATEISHETEICFRGRCIKTNSATADDDLRKLVQSADKVLKT